MQATSTTLKAHPVMARDISAAVSSDFCLLARPRLLFRLEDNLTVRDRNSRSATFREKTDQARNTQSYLPGNTHSSVNELHSNYASK